MKKYSGFQTPILPRSHLGVVLTVVMIALVTPFTALGVASDIAITEVMFNPEGVDTGFEYVVLENSGSESVDLSGWDFYPDGVGYYTFPNFALGGGKSVTIYLRASGDDGAERLYHSTASNNMGNTSGSLALFSSTDHKDAALIDFIEYGKAGETWESSADKVGLWKKGEYISLADFQEGQVLARKDAGHGVASWEIKNVSENVESAASPPPPSVSSVGGGVYSGPEIKPKIRAYAGRDKTSVAGAEVIFEGKALGTQDERLSSDLIRYAWNFGDGALVEGKKVSHIYEFPGTYTATLYVISGEDSESDSTTIAVAENPIRISEIFPGGGGWIELSNPSSVDVDISAWKIQSGEKAFVFPERSVIAARSFVIFPAATTGFEISTQNPQATLFYPNGKKADELLYAGVLAAGESLARLDRASAAQKPTPGRSNIIQPPAVISPPRASTAAPPPPAKAEEVIVSENPSSTPSRAPEPSPLTANVFNAERKWFFVSVVGGVIAGSAVLVLRSLWSKNE